MLERRVKRLLNYANSGRILRRFQRGPQKDHTADIRPRHPALLNLEGWYETEVVVPEKYQSLYQRYKESGSNLKITRWALRNGLLDEVGVSDLGKNLDTTKFKLSCRHNDLLRLAETIHYASCMDGVHNGQQQLQYLADPDMAVIFVPDAAGKYSWRCLARLVMDDDEGALGNGYAFEKRTYGLALYRVYGNGPSEAIYQALDKVVRVYQARDIRHYNLPDREVIIKTSPTVHNNKFLSRPIWTDHQGIGWDHMRRMKIQVIKRGKTVHFTPQEVRQGYAADVMLLGPGHFGHMHY